MSTGCRARLLSSPPAPSTLSSGSAAATLIALLALVVVLVPSPHLTLLLTPFNGFEHLIVTWPEADLSGASLWMQAWVQSTGTPAGWAASNAVTVP